jgi:hypothetical protein
MTNQKPIELVIRWPDGEEEPLTPELGEALAAIVRVFGNGCQYVTRRRAKERQEARPEWLIPTPSPATQPRP